MHLQIRWTKLIPWQYGNKIEITHLWLYDDNGKYIKFIAMDEQVAEFLKTFSIAMNTDILLNADKKWQINTPFKIE